MTILDCCISLKGIKKLVVLGVVDMRQLLLNNKCKALSRIELTSDFNQYFYLDGEQGHVFCSPF